MHEAASFSSRAARVLAGHIFNYQCSVNFKDLFPIIIEFYSRHELEDFLELAFHYALDNDWEEATDVYLRRYENKHYTGYMQVIIMFCIITSDYIRKCKNDKMIFYSSLPLFYGPFAKIISKLKILMEPAQCDILYHHFYNMEIFENEEAVNSLRLTYEMELFSDVYYLQYKVDPHRPMFLLKDKYAMLFSLQLDGSIQMTLSRKESDLEKYYSYMTEIAGKANFRSFDQDGVQKYLQSNPDLDPDLKKKIEAIDGLFLRDYSTLPSEGSAAEFLDTILAEEAEFFVSADLLTSFIYNSDVVVPIIMGAGISAQVRMAYLLQAKDYVAEKKDLKFFLVHTPLYKMTVITKGEWSLMAVVNLRSKKLKYHLLKSVFLKPLMEAAASETALDPREYFAKLSYVPDVD